MATGRPVTIAVQQSVEMHLSSAIAPAIEKEVSDLGEEMKKTEEFIAKLRQNTNKAVTESTVRAIIEEQVGIRRVKATIHQEPTNALLTDHKRAIKKIKR